MIRWFRRLSLARQVVFMTASTSTLVLGLALIALLVIDATTYRRQLSNNLASVARVIANANTATLAFDDARSASENLAALRDNAEIVAVSILNQQGEVFAEYSRPGLDDSVAGPDVDSDAGESGLLGYFTSGFGNGELLRVDWPVVLDAEEIGRVVVFGDLIQLHDRREWYAVVFASMLGIFASISYGLAFLFQDAITKPMRTLAANMRRVSEEVDYSIRCEGAGDGEFGTLIEGFNEMLDKIEVQDGRLAQHRDHLEDIVEQRTEELRGATRDLELSIDVIREAKEGAEAASVAKSNFLACMSHEIRTPLNGVLGMLELLSQSTLSPEQKHRVDAAFKSGENLVEVINKILDFSKIEAGKLVLDEVEFDLWENTEDTVEMFAESARAKGLELTCFIDDEVPERIVGDPVRLRQILANLVSNAVKFTHRGEIAVTVKAGGLTESSASIHLGIRDTGIGIAPNLREHLFDAFTQADVSITRQFGGTGLGLTIAQQLTHAMGGEIGFTTHRVHGTTFEFTVLVGLPESATPAEPLRHPGLRGAQALIASGGKTLRTILERYMRSWRMEVAQLDSPDAISTILQGIDAGGRNVALFLDADSLRAPEIDLIRRINDEPAGSRPHIILLTGPTPRHDTEATAIGRSLAKPVRKARLAEALVAAFAGEANEPEAPASVPVTDPESLDLRILLAEDNAVNQEVAAGMLESLGCQVDIVDDGEQAVFRAASGRYDFILMDCQMPGMDGYRAALRIRYDEQARGDDRVPILALTAHAEDGARDKCLAAGMDDYLAKPFGCAELAEMLGRSSHRPIEVDDPSPGGPGSQPASADVLDPEVLEKLGRLPGGNGSDLRRRALAVYLDTSPDLMNQLRKAVAEDAAELIGDTAHALKSCSANIGALELASHCQELESRARNDPAAGWDDLFRPLEEVFALALEATETVMQEAETR